jgi:hypothetical protein
MGEARAYYRGPLFRAGIASRAALPIRFLIEI